MNTSKLYQNKDFTVSYCCISLCAGRYMKEKVDYFFRRILHRFFRKAPYRKAMKTV